MSTKPVLILVGPTAVGKTALSIKLAQMYNAEIISADSRQIYKYMHIGTAKPTRQERAGIPHHFMDMIEPGVAFSAGQFGQQAREKVSELLQKGKNVIVSGGTGLYIRALLYGFIEIENPPQSMRKTMASRLEVEGLEALYAELKTVDAELAIRLAPNDKQRILRGLEVYHTTGKKLSEIQQQEQSPANFKWVQVALNTDRAYLYNRINSRVDEMWAHGLRQEVETLSYEAKWQETLKATVGYKEVLEYFNGTLDEELMLGKIKQNSRRYAKRQLTWFRKDKSITWFESRDLDLLEQIEQAWK